MAVSELIKDDSILDLLAKLNEELGENFYDVVDHWEGSLDSCLLYTSPSPRDRG